MLSFFESHVTCSDIGQDKWYQNQYSAFCLRKNTFSGSQLLYIMSMYLFSKRYQIYDTYVWNTFVCRKSRAVIKASMEFLRCHLIPVKTQFLSFDCFYLSLVYLNFSFFFLGRKVVFLNVSSFCEKPCTYHWSEWTIKMGFNRSDCKVYWYGQTREYPDIISSAVWHWQIDATTSCNWNSKFLCVLKLIFSRTTLF